MPLPRQKRQANPPGLRGSVGLQIGPWEQNNEQPPAAAATATAATAATAAAGATAATAASSDCRCMAAVAAVAVACIPIVHASDVSINLTSGGAGCWHQWQEIAILILVGLASVLSALLHVKRAPESHSYTTTIIGPSQETAQTSPRKTPNEERGTQTAIVVIPPYWEYSAVELRNLARDRGLDANQLKASIIRELVQHDANKSK